MSRLGLSCIAGPLFQQLRLKLVRAIAKPFKGDLQRVIVLDFLLPTSVTQDLIAHSEFAELSAVPVVALKRSGEDDDFGSELVAFGFCLRDLVENRRVLLTERKDARKLCRCPEVRLDEIAVVDEGVERGVVLPFDGTPVVLRRIADDPGNCRLPGAVGAVEVIEGRQTVERGRAAPNVATPAMRMLSIMGSFRERY